jgi:hypothetical protein
MKGVSTTEFEDIPLHKILRTEYLASYEFSWNRTINISTLDKVSPESKSLEDVLLPTRSQ